MYQIARTEASHNNNLEHISHWRKIQAQILLKHNHQAHNSECNVKVSCHELQMDDERNLVYRSHSVHDYTISCYIFLLVQKLRVDLGPPDDKNN